MASTKYEELQFLTRDYGEQTREFIRDVKASGQKIIEAYAEYLGGPKTAVKAVPPSGEFQHQGPYRDEAFDCYGRGMIYLQPICMGVCTNIQNQSGNGAVLVRTVIEFRSSIPGLRVSVGDKAKKFHTEDGLENVMHDICGAIFEDAHHAFSIDLDEAQGSSRIGFMPNTIDH